MSSLTTILANVVEVAVEVAEVETDVVAVEVADVVADVDPVEVAEVVAVDVCELVCVVDGDVFWQECSSYKVPARY